MKASEGLSRVALQRVFDNVNGVVDRIVAEGQEVLPVLLFFLIERDDFELIGTVSPDLINRLQADRRSKDAMDAGDRRGAARQDPGGTPQRGRPHH